MKAKEVKRRIMLGIIAAAIVFVLGSFFALGQISKKPVPVGLVNGKLRPVPASPNCVSSQAPAGEAAIAPIAFKGDPKTARKKLLEVVQKIPRAKMISEANNYIHFEFTSAIFGFVDDVEFVLDEAASVIDVRSASRVGHSDLGANRARVEAIRKNFAE